MNDVRPLRLVQASLAFGISGNNIKTRKGWSNSAGITMDAWPKKRLFFPEKPMERDRALPLRFFPFFISPPFLVFHLFFSYFFSPFIYFPRIGSGNASGLTSMDNTASLWRCNLLWNFSSTSRCGQASPLFLTNIYGTNKKAGNTRPVAGKFSRTRKLTDPRSSGFFGEKQREIDEIDCDWSIVPTCFFVPALTVKSPFLPLTV